MHHRSPTRLDLHTRASSSASTGTLQGRVAIALLLIATASGATAIGAPFTDGNLLVTESNELREYTIAGGLVQSIAVPYGGGTRPGTESARDIIFDENAELVVYDGTFSPFAAVYDPVGGTWTHHTEPGWSTVNNVSYGGIARAGSFVFATDMSTAGTGSPRGLVRFDVAGGYAAQRFAETSDTIDVTVGLDGLVYGLWSETGIRVYDPQTLGLVGTISLQRGCRGIAVDAIGRVFGASWDGNIYRFSNVGQVLDSIPSGDNNLVDIDLLDDGRIVVGSRFGTVIQTTIALASATTFSVGSLPVFVAFVDNRPTTTVGEQLASVRPRLFQNYPNPFNPSTSIRFDLAHDSAARLRIFDSGGRLVRVLVDGSLGAGTHLTRWDGTVEGGQAAASGVYFYRLETAELQSTGRMVLAR